MKESEIKKIITESVIGFLNGKKSPDDFDIPDEDKKKIEEIVKKTLNRKGLLSLTYRTDVEEGKTSVGARIDPTAKGKCPISLKSLININERKLLKKRIIKPKKKIGVIGVDEDITDSVPPTTEEELIKDTKLPLSRSKGYGHAGLVKKLTEKISKQIRYDETTRRWVKR